MTIIDAILGLTCFYYSTVVEGSSEFIFFVFLSSVYFTMLVLRARRFSIEREKKRKRILRRKAKRSSNPVLWYDDLGQAYVYEVKSGDTSVRCFSDFLFGPDSPVDLIEILVRDGKLTLKESGSKVEIKVNMRRKVQ